MGFVANLFGGGAARHAANVANVRQQQLAAQQRALGQQQYNAVLGMGQQNYNTLLGQGQTAYNELTGVIPGIQANFQPMIAAGQTAAQTYQNELPQLTAQYDPTMAKLAATPGYQFALNQGLQAAQNAAAARGLGVSGNALQAAGNYATGLAQNTYAQDAGIYQQGQQIAANTLLNGINAGTQAANASGTLTSGLMDTATGLQGTYNNNAANLLQGAQQTASADLINANNSAAASASTGYQDAASGQIAYNNALASGINVLANGINQGVGYLTSKPPQKPATTPLPTSTASLTPNNSTVSLGSNLLLPGTAAPSAYGSASNLYGTSTLTLPAG